MNKLVKIDVKQQLIESYTPYSMSVILDRALPDIRDGLKPVHRKILYAMNNKGITHNKDRAKSSEPVAETLKIHGHGDVSVYNALAIMTEQNESLLHPFIDGEGAFGKVYCNDSPSAMRYTFARLNKFSQELFKDVNKGILNMIGDDKEHLHPEVLSSDFPMILVKNNSGIAVGFACNFPSFNLREVCNASIGFIKDTIFDPLNYLKGFDFSTGGQLIYNESQFRNICNNGEGKLLIRSKYTYNDKDRIIEIKEIPYNTTANTIISEITGMMKAGKLKDVLDIRDETGFNPKIEKSELNICIDVKKNTDIDRLMNLLFHTTSLQKSFSANMNCLVNYEPKVMGVTGIIKEWLRYRQECVVAGIKFDINNKQEELNKMNGFKKVLLDIDKCIEIIRNSKDDNTIITDLMEYFKLNESQAKYVSEMKLRNINKNHIINKIKGIEDLEEELRVLLNNVNNTEYIDNIIIKALEDIRDRYGKDRITEIISEENVEKVNKKELLIQEYNCRIAYTKNFIKKHLKYSENHKIKDGEKILGDIESTNKSTLLIFTNKRNRYKINVCDLDTVSPSNYGQYIPSLIELEDGEEIIKIVSVADEKGYIVAVFENGKVAKIGIKPYLSNNKKIVNCYNEDSKLIDIDYTTKDIDILLVSSEGKGLVIDTSKINPKQSKNSMGVTAMKLIDNIKCIGSIIGVNKENKITLHTDKNTSHYFMLDDVSMNNTKNWLQYLTGRCGNQGNFIYNTRVKENQIIRMEIE